MALSDNTASLTFLRLSAVAICFTNDDDTELSGNVSGDDMWGYRSSEVNWRTGFRQTELVPQPCLLTLDTLELSSNDLGLALVRKCITPKVTITEVILPVEEATQLDRCVCQRLQLAQALLAIGVHISWPRCE
jgi:hypothetical protein